VKQAANSCATVQELLLDYAYGELESAPRQDVDAHLTGCADCRLALRQLSGTRTLMSQLAPEPAPEAGLDSLLAYAEQAASRREARPHMVSVLWRWLVPGFGLAGAAAAALLLVSKPGDPARGLTPSAAVVQETAARPVPAQPLAAASEEKRKAPDVLEEDKPQPAEAQAMRTDAPADLDEGLAAEPARVASKSARPTRQREAGEEAERGRGGLLALAKDEKKAAETRRSSAQPPPADGKASAVKEKGGAGGGGQATGSSYYARGPAQSPTYGAVELDQAAGGESGQSKIAGIVSNVDPLGGAQAVPLPASKPAAAMPPAAAPQPASPPAPAPAPEVASESVDRAAAKAKKSDTTTVALAQADREEETALGEGRAQVPLAKSAADSSRQLSPEELLRMGADQSTHGQLEAAEATYARFLVLYPMHAKAPEVALWRVDLLVRLGRTGDAAVARAEYARRWPTVAPGAAAASGPRSAPAAPMRSAPMEKHKSAESFDDEAATNAK